MMRYVSNMCMMKRNPVVASPVTVGNYGTFWNIIGVHPNAGAERWWNIMRVGGHMRNEKHLGCSSANEGVIYLHTFPGD